MTALLDALGVDRVTDLEELPAGGRLVVVVAHPDDEALATGGLIAHRSRTGGRVLVVAVTDGEHAFADAPIDLAAVRRSEQDRSLATLGVAAANVIRLGVPDGSVEQFADAITDALVQVVGVGDVLVAPSPWDWHPDHEACGAAAREAAELTGATLLFSTFWAHHHPEALVRASGMLHRLRLTPEDQLLRSDAVACHRSQLGQTGREPVVRAREIVHLDEPAEYYHR